MVSLVPTVHSSDFDNDIKSAFNTVRLFRVTPANGWQTVRQMALSTFQEAETAKQARELLESQIVGFLEGSGEKTDWLLSIPPIGSEGFAIDLSKNGELFCVVFGELEENFTRLTDALDWIGRALSDAYQLRITLIGGRRREWTLEPVVPNGQNPILASGHFVPFRSFRSITSLVYKNSFTASRQLAS